MPNNITCEAVGCNNNKGVNLRYCSTECTYASRKKIVLRLRDSCKKCKKPLTNKDVYQNTKGLSSYCKECRKTKTSNKIKLRGVEREKFVRRFNKIVGS